MHMGVLEPSSLACASSLAGAPPEPADVLRNAQAFLQKRDPSFR